MTDRKPGVSAAVLKTVAVVTMFIDHFAVVFGDKLYPALPFLKIGGNEVLRIIGRIAFPLFAFMIAEGASRTKNVYKYLLRLFVFAFVSEIPFDLAVQITPFSDISQAMKHQNVFFTLFLGLTCIFLYQRLKEIKLEFFAFAFLLFTAFAAQYWLKTDYGAMGVIGIFLFYVFLQAPAGVKQAGLALTVAAISLILAFSPYTQHAVTVSGKNVTLLHMDASVRVNTFELYALLSVPLILLYNGEKGKQPNRWFFYAFYPAHLLLLWAVYWLIFRMN